MPIHDWTRVNHGTFHDFHQAWLATLRGALNNGALPRAYYAMIEQHTPEGIPDLLALQVEAPPPEEPSSSTSDGTAGVATVTAAPPRVWYSSEVVPDVYARRRRTVTIRRVDGDRVVAVIEVVSPGNKSSRNGLREFTEKVISSIDHGIHVLVVDLFPPGPRNPNGIHPVIWSGFLDDGYTQPADKPLTIASYAAGPMTRAYVQPTAVGETFPEIPFFLTSDTYIHPPLEASYQAAWDGTPWRVKEKLEDAHG